MINKINKFGKNKKVYWLKNRKKERKVKKENWMIKMNKILDPMNFNNQEVF